MMFYVSVPVLSEKMYLTWPSSSLRLEDCTFVSIPILSSKIVQSHTIKRAWKNLTTSSDTRSDIGTRLVQIRIQLPYAVRKVLI